MLETGDACHDGSGDVYVAIIASMSCVIELSVSSYRPSYYTFAKVQPAPGETTKKIPCKNLLENQTVSFWRTIAFHTPVTNALAGDRRGVGAPEGVRRDSEALRGGLG